MFLPESEGKRLLRDALVPTADGTVVTSEAELDSRSPWTFPVAAKAQIAAGGRGKAGGVVACESKEALREAFRRIMATTFSGEAPSGVLVEPWLSIDRELYLSVSLDASAGGFCALYSPTGGVEIEFAEVMVRYPFGRPEDFRGHRLREILIGVEPDAAVRERVVSLTRRLLAVVVRHEAITVEINPVAVCAGNLVAVDAKIMLDDAASFRHQMTMAYLEDAHAREDQVSQACRDARLVFVPLGGNVGLLSGGAGMTMRAMDAIAEAGGSAAGFLDISNNPTPDGLATALSSLMQIDGVDRVLISIFGGGLDVGRIARSLAKILDASGFPYPIAFRLSGSGRDTATELLASRGVRNHDTLEDAVADLMTKAPSA